jgi:hypothetical protein
MIMIDFSKTTAALALGLTLGLALAATPATAKQRAAHPGYAARAQVFGESGELPISGPRAAALRECSDKVAPLKDYTWGMEQTDQYRACMAQHGQIE